MKKYLLLLTFLLFLLEGYSQTTHPDSSFGRNGIVYTDFGTTGPNTQVSDNISHKVLLNGDGTYYLLIEINNQSVMAHYLANGTLDAAYGNNGYSEPADFVAYDAALQKDGKVVVAGSALTRFNVNGTIDKSFGTEGVVTTTSGIGTINSVAIQSDGKIVVIGSALTRFNANGTIDKSFGAEGVVTIAFGIGNIHSIAIQPNGKIVVAGTTVGYKFALTRYNVNGSLDSSFGRGGLVTTSSPSLFGDYAQPTIYSLNLQPNGKIVATGTATEVGKFNTLVSSVFALARYNADGSTDSSFGKGGLVTTPFLHTSSNGTLYTYFYAYSAALQSDGKIIAAGTTGYSAHDEPEFGDALALARYNPNGSLDSSFGIKGVVTTALGHGNINSVAIQSNGKIVTAGTAFINGLFGFALARYNPNGSLDASFGNGGIVKDYIRTGTSYYVKAIAQSDGKLVAAGYANKGDSNYLVLARYNHKGSLDSSFGSGGKMITSFSDMYFNINSLKLQSDGKIIAAGGTVNSNGSGFILARFNQNGSLDASFGNSGITVTLFVNTTSYSFFNASIESIGIQKDGKIVATGNVPNSTSANLALARYSADGVLDRSFGNGGIVTHASLYISAGLALQQDGKALVAAGSSIARFNTDGSLDKSFGSDGLSATIPNPGNPYWSFRINAVVVQKDGKIVAGGSAGQPKGAEFTLIRLNSNGSLDSAFGYGGVTGASFIPEPEPYFFSTIRSLREGTDGKIVAAGDFDDTFNGNGTGIAAARFNLNGSLDSSFSSGGTIKASFDIRSVLIDSNRVYAIGSVPNIGEVAAIEAFRYSSSCTPFTVRIPDVKVLSSGVQPNTVYHGYAPADSLTLTAQVSNPGGTYTYLWCDGQTSSCIKVSPKADKHYSVIVTSLGGCTASTGIEVKVVDVHCGNRGDKVVVCKPQGSSGKERSLCIGAAAVAAQLRTGASLGACSNTDAIVEAEGLSLSAGPNPSRSAFTLQLSSTEESKVTLLITDVVGRVVETKVTAANGSVQLGGAYPPGIYYVKAVQGRGKATIKLIKQAQ